MSTALLTELHQELFRLFVAGSDLSAGDVRLKRLLPQFRQLGERSPVFKKLGDMIDALIEPSGAEASSAEQLLELNMLLDSVLYTQGATASEGELAPIAGITVELSAKTPYRKLSPILTALSTTGSGRYEIVRDAFEAGLFADLRLVEPSIAALNDPYPELADFIQENVLPAFGDRIVPMLAATFDPAGGKSEMRKLTVLGKLAGDAYENTIAQAAESGSDDVRVAAIELLAGKPAYEAQLIAWSKDRKKSIRVAAYRALAGFDTSAAAARLDEAVSGKDADEAAQAADASQSPLLTSLLVAGLPPLLHQLLEAHEKKDNDRYYKVLDLMKARVNALWDKKSEELYAFYMDALLHESKLGFLGLRAAEYLADTDRPEAFQLMSRLARKNDSYLPFAFRMAFRLLSPVELYEKYGAPYFKKSLKGITTNEQKKIIETISSLVMVEGRESFEAAWATDGHNVLHRSMIPPVEQIALEWDARWVDWLIAADAGKLVAVMSQPGDMSALAYLLEKLDKQPRFERGYAGLLLEGLERCGYSQHDIFERVVVMLENPVNHSCYRIDAQIASLLRRLPNKYLDRMEPLVERYRYHFMQEELKAVVARMNGASAQGLGAVGMAK